MEDKHVELLRIKTDFGVREINNYVVKYVLNNRNSFRNCTQKNLIKKIMKEYDAVILKHPEFVFDNNLFQGVSIISEELGELAQEINNGNIDNARNECIDLIISGFRMLELLSE